MKFNLPGIFFLVFSLHLFTPIFCAAQNSSINTNKSENVTIIKDDIYNNFPDNLNQQNRKWMSKIHGTTVPDFSWLKMRVEVNNNPSRFSFSEHVDLYENGNVVKSLLQTRSDSGVVSQQITTNHYNESGSIKGSLTEIWENGKRTNYSKYLCEYDEYNKLIAQTNQYWLENKWIDQSRTTYSYQDTLLQESLIEYYESGTWIYGKRDLNLYNENGYDSLKVTQYWNGSDWTDRYKNIYTTDERGNITEDSSQSWNGNEWVNIIKYNSKYDQNYKRSESSVQYWRINGWENGYSYTHKYDNDGLLIEVFVKIWIENNWADYYKEIYTRGSSDMLVLTQPGDGQELSTSAAYFPDWIGYGVENVNIEFSADNGATWSTVAENIPFESQYQWTAPDTEMDNCKIKISDSADPNTYSQNEGTFKILKPRISILTHQTGKVNFSVFENGILGYNSNTGLGEGFSFNGFPNALYTGGIILGTKANGINGMVGSFGIYDCIYVSPMSDFTSNSNFDQISDVTFTDTLAPNPLELSVQQLTLSKAGDPFVFCYYKITNNSEAEIQDLYAGVFADWDIGNFEDNLGGYDADRNLAYQFDNSGADPNYYGITALSGMSGARVASENLGDNSRDEIFNYISTFMNEAVAPKNDFRSFIGSGPFNILEGKSRLVGFAILAGSNLDELKTISDEAQLIWNSGRVGIDENAVLAEPDFQLLQNYPNPFNPATIIEYNIPAIPSNRRGSELVTLIVYDILGREIATLVNERQNAGYHKVIFNTDSVGKNGLTSGVYFYTLKAGSRVQSKKMMLIR